MWRQREHHSFSFHLLIEPLLRQLPFPLLLLFPRILQAQHGMQQPPFPFWLLIQQVAQTSSLPLLNFLKEVQALFAKLRWSLTNLPSFSQFLLFYAATPELLLEIFEFLFVCQLSKHHAKQFDFLFPPIPSAFEQFDLLI